MIARLPDGFRFERLARSHPRRAFACGEEEVDAWLAKHALQNQDKRLSATRVLLDESGTIAGYYTLATGQVDFAELPLELTRKLPKRALPVAVLAWLGVDGAFQDRGLGRCLVAQALIDCHAAGQTFAFVAVILDCLNDAAKSFYRQWDFEELPGHPYRLFLGAARLQAMIDVA